MKPFLLFSAILLFAGACSQPSGTESVIALPEESHIVALDSVDTGVLLNPIDITATGNHLIVANMHKDTIFDVFDLQSLGSGEEVGSGRKDRKGAAGHA